MMSIQRLIMTKYVIRVFPEGIFGRNWEFCHATPALRQTFAISGVWWKHEANEGLSTWWNRLSIYEQHVIYSWTQENRLRLAGQLYIFPAQKSQLKDTERTLALIYIQTRAGEHWRQDGYRSYYDTSRRLSLPKPTTSFEKRAHVDHSKYKSVQKLGDSSLHN